MDAKKFAFILCQKDSNDYQNIVQMINNINVPSGYQAEVVMFSGVDNLAKMYNRAISMTDAMYKIYLNSKVKSLNKDLLNLILRFFSWEPTATILGMYGSELPLDADYLNAKNIYGNYYYQLDETIRCHRWKIPVYVQKVDTIDDSFFITRTNELWDEEMSGPFLLSSYCVRAALKGDTVIVPSQDFGLNEAMIIFAQDIKRKYWRENRSEFDIFRQKFKRKYERFYLPLVSILIPAYNQPIMFEQALKSALEQTYKNIEVLVGDDSTDTRINKLIQPYLKRYNNLKYFFHGSPLGGSGYKNTEFLLSKSQGEYINILYQDDLLKKEKISFMMEYYKKDLNNEIGIITSSRYLIDEKNEIKGLMPGVIVSGEDQVSASLEVGRKILTRGINFIGEFSTTLLPKKTVYSQLRKKSICGYYYGMRDHSLGDISTWLEILRKGKKVVRIATPLSFFRRHAGQNTYKNIIQIRGRLDWLAFYVLSWSNEIWINSEMECFNLCKEFLLNNQLHINETDLDDNGKKYFHKYKNIYELTIANDSKRVIDEISKYIAENIA